MPTREQIEVVANNLADALGSGVHLWTSDLIFAIDANYPTATDEEFESIRNVCVQVADDIRHDALSMMWDARE